MSGGGFFGGANVQSQDNSGAAKRAIRPVRALMISQVIGAELEYGNQEGPAVIDQKPVANAVLCVELLDASESSKRSKNNEDDGDSFNAQTSKRLKVGDSTGTLEVRLSPFNSVQVSDLEENLNQFGNMYGHFRIFGGKVYFEYDRFEFDIDPYQFLYHEIEAARESYHFKDVLEFGDSFSNADETPQRSDYLKNEVEEPMFVANPADDELIEQVLGIVKSFEDTDEGASTEYIVAELKREESKISEVLSSLESNAKIYEIDGCWRAN